MRKFLINVNGNSYEVEVEEIGASASAAPMARPAATPAAPAAAPVAAPKTAPSAPAGGTSINSPMPGTILDVKVSVGATVAEGDTILILEAMKMENEILASCAGKITSLPVDKGASVNSGDLLAVIG